jgi:exosortase C (VPDSG-CTERM-specific)
MNGSRDLTGAPDRSAVPLAATVDVGSGKPSSRLLGFSIFLVILTAVFGRNLFLLFTEAVQSDLNSYIVLIPFVSLYFLYVERARLSRSYESSVGGALVLFLVGSAVLIFYATAFTRPGSLSNNDRLSFVTFSFVCFLWSGAFFFLGRKWLATAAFPMLFLIFLVPLPDRIVDWMETGLRLASAQAADLFFAITGTPAMKTGTVFQLPGIAIEVAQECSGIKSSWVLFITSVIAAQLFLSKPWSRLTLIAMVIPLGILRNGFRIMVIGLLCVHISPDMIHSQIHRRGGPVFFALSLIPLLLALWFLKRREMASKQPVVALPMSA